MLTWIHWSIEGMNSLKLLSNLCSGSSLIPHLYHDNNLLPSLLPAVLCQLQSSVLLCWKHKLSNITNVMLQTSDQTLHNSQHKVLYKTSKILYKALHTLASILLFTNSKDLSPQDEPYMPVFLPCQTQPYFCNSVHDYTFLTMYSICLYITWKWHALSRPGDNVTSTMSILKTVPWSLCPSTHIYTPRGITDPILITIAFVSAL